MRLVIEDGLGRGVPVIDLQGGTRAAVQALLDRLRGAVERELPEHRDAFAPALDAAADAVRKPR